MAFISSLCVQVCAQADQHTMSGTSALLCLLVSAMVCHGRGFMSASFSSFSQAHSNAYTTHTHAHSQEQSGAVPVLHRLILKQPTTFKSQPCNMHYNQQVYVSSLIRWDLPDLRLNVLLECMPQQTNATLICWKTHGSLTAYCTLAPGMGKQRQLRHFLLISSSTATNRTNTWACRRVCTHKHFTRPCFRPRQRL